MSNGADMFAPLDGLFGALMWEGYGLSLREKELMALAYAIGFFSGTKRVKLQFQYVPPNESEESVE